MKTTNKLNKKLNAEMITRRKYLINFLHILSNKINHVATCSMECNQNDTTSKLDNLLRQVNKLREKN